MTRRLTSHHYEALARERQFEWLGEEVPQNVNERTAWRCAEGHRWETAYRTIKYGGCGCPYCSRRARKNAMDYHALARQFDFVWLGPEVKNTKTKTGWRCFKNHEWMATYGSISQGTGCPYCAKKAPKTEDDYIALAKERGFVWLGPMVPKVVLKTRWQCAKEHIWEASYFYILSGTGCPACAGRKRKTESDFHALAKKRGFIWRGPLVKNTQTETQWECGIGHTWWATYASIYQRRHCPICAPKKPKAKADYHALANQQGLEWLGPPVKNTKTKTEWRCKNDHTWFAIYSSIQQGSGCPTCARSGFKTEADYHALAALRGLEWLGPLPKNVNTKSRWRCGKGHPWLATYNGIRRRGKCPICTKIDNQPKS